MDNVNKLPNEISKEKIVKDIIDFLNNDKKRPICTPLSLDENN